MEEVREQLERRVLAPVQVEDMVAVLVWDMAARLGSAMAARYRTRHQDTRYRRLFRIRTRVARITAHQASARGMQCKGRFKRCFRAHTRVVGIAAGRASAQDTRCKRRPQTHPPGIRARQASARDTRMGRSNVSACTDECIRGPSTGPATGTSSCYLLSRGGLLSARGLTVPRLLFGAIELHSLRQDYDAGARRRC